LSVNEKSAGHDDEIEHQDEHICISSDLLRSERAISYRKFCGLAQYRLQSNQKRLLHQLQQIRQTRLL
jgi:hypothetical protein